VSVGCRARLADALVLATKSRVKSSDVRDGSRLIGQVQSGGRINLPILDAIVNENNSPILVT
jgi:hypothetical protein